MLAFKKSEAETQILETFESDFFWKVVNELEINKEVYKFFGDFEAEGARVRGVDDFGLVGASGNDEGVGGHMLQGFCQNSVLRGLEHFHIVWADSISFWC